MKLRAIQSGGSACPACGNHVEWGKTPEAPDKANPDTPWACSPCRAEAAGVVELRLPPQVLPAGAVRSVAVDRDHWAIQMVLRVWADALAGSAERVRELATALESAPDEEAVAHAIMGGAQPPALTLVQDNPRALCLGELDPAAARRLAETCALAVGPATLAPELKERVAAELFAAQLRRVAGE